MNLTARNVVQHATELDRTIATWLVGEMTDADVDQVLAAQTDRDAVKQIAGAALRRVAARFTATPAE